MLTGDALSVATHIGKQVGLGGNIIGLGHSKTDKTEDKVVAMGNFNVEGIYTLKYLSSFHY